MPAAHDHRRSPYDGGKAGRAPAGVYLTVAAGWLAGLAGHLKAHLEASRDDERGNVITDNLAWIVFGVIAIVAIGAAIKLLGSTVVSWAQSQLGV